MPNATLAFMSKTPLPYLPLSKIQIYLANRTIYGSDFGSIAALSIYSTSSQYKSNSGILPGQSCYGLCLKHFLLQEIVDVEVEKSEQSQEPGP